MSVIERLKQRKIVQWVLAYLAGAWLALQVVGEFREPWGWSDAVVRGVHLALAIGFALTVVGAWYHGERGRQQVSGVELIIAAGVLGVGGLLFRTMVGGESSAPPPTPTEATTAERLGPAVAVLPFENFSPDPDDAYFADGMHVQVIGQLSKISALEVKSRSSVMRYAELRPSVREIGDALEVGFVIEGNAWMAGGRVRLTATLIDAVADEQLWTEEYERDLSVEDLLEIEDDLATRVARSMSARILPEEADRISQFPTESLEAYQHYLRGLSYWARRTTYANRPAAVEAFQSAVTADPGFGVGWAKLAEANLWLRAVDANLGTWILVGRGFHPDTLLRRAEQALDSARSLVPGAPETVLAEGRYLYNGLRDYERALAFFRQVPDPDSDIIGMMGGLERRLGRWDDALAHHLQRAAAEPTPQIFYTVAQTARMMRRHAEALRLTEQGINLAYDFQPVWSERFQTYLQIGDTASAWRTVDEYASIVGEDAVSGWRLTQAWYRFGPQATVALRQELFPDDTTSLSSLVDRRLAGLDVPPSWGGPGIEEGELELREWTSAGNIPGAVLARGRLALYLAVAGHSTRASEELEEVLDADPMSVDGLVGWTAVANAMVAAIILEEGDQALRAVEMLLARPSYYTVERFRQDPALGSMRDDPRFEALMERYQLGG